MSQLLLSGQQQHVHVVVLRQGAGEGGTFSAKQEEQGDGDVGGGLTVAHHLEEGRVIAVAPLVLV